MAKGSSRDSKAAWIKSIEGLIEPEAPGPSITFSTQHLILAMLFLGDAKVVGRKRLAERLRLGEGAVRTLIDRLKRLGYLSITKLGCRLTSKGMYLYSKLKQGLPMLAPIDAGPLSTGAYNVAIVVRGAREVVPIRQRDAAIRAGAQGATTLVYSGNRFKLPEGSDDCERDHPDPLWSRLSQFGLRDGDVVIVVGGPSIEAAEHGALKAALTLL